MSDVLERLGVAMNAHDAEQVAALFAEDYQSTQPIHANRDFGGRAQVLANWSSVFEGVPDFTATVVSASRGDDTLWTEWEWRGSYADGSAFAMSGVTILTVRDDLITEGRLYMEPVDAAGEDIDAAVQELYKPPSDPSG